jgi:hypothetical protein
MLHNVRVYRQLADGIRMDVERLRLLSRIGISTIAILAVAGTLTLAFALMTAQMGTMFFALLAGALGAEVSIIRRIPTLKDADVSALVGSWWSLVVPLLAGSVMAGVLYLVFMAGILTGDGGEGLFTSNLFPTFKAPPVKDPLDLHVVLEIRPASIKDFGKLMAWCFLSGYSERFVPSLLQSLEQRGSGSGRD